MDVALYIFRRDLRLHDNTALRAALEQHERVLPIFVFTPEQVGEENRYRSENAIQFMCESLAELKKELPLKLFRGELDEVLKGIRREVSELSAVYVNRDYTPYAVKRDRSLERWCKKEGLAFHSFEDCLLTGVDEICKDDGSYYTVFTPFKNKGRKIMDPPRPFQERRTSFYKPPKKKFPHQLDRFDFEKNAQIHLSGGRQAGLQLLKNLKNHKRYKETRNFPKLATSNLSAHLKFGTISVREAYWSMVKQLGGEHGLVDQLFWREFYTVILAHNPHLLGKPFRDRGIKWEWNKTWFDLWCAGETGFPIVDAGMRQLNETGYMHNRCRMIVAMFLTKDLLIDWRKGERYFAQRLVDYDPALNNGNWQWNAGIGVDPAPTGPRIFNPWLQSERFDPDATYIKHWVPELEGVPAKEIHRWYQAHEEYEGDYPAPMVDHKEQREKFLQLYLQK